jgi:hypothetical protein
METAVAPVAQAPVGQNAPARTSGSRIRPEPAEQKDLAAIQQAGGNQAVQRLLDAGPAEARPSTDERAPATPEEDPAYQGVVARISRASEHEKTPVKKPAVKREEVKQAAELPVDTRTKENAYDHHLGTMGDVRTPTVAEYTVEGFSEAFKKKVDEIASQLPKEKKEQGSVAKAVAFGAQKVAAAEQIRTQNQNLSQPLREETARDPLKTEKPAPEAPTLAVDPKGNTPQLPHAGSAAPKPRADREVAMESESQALDDAFKGHNAGGQQININEDSLAYPVSGEKSFDEAGESKRKAQEEIRKILPRYREVEKGVIGASRAQMPAIVKAGLNKQHQSRSDTFDSVLEKQQTQEGVIEKDKGLAFQEFQKIYDRTKGQVAAELKKLENIETDFEKVITDAENYFKKWVRNDLEYIYTPGFFDYSDWKDKRADAIKKEYERLKKTKKPTYMGAIDSLWLEAMENVRDEDAKRLFQTYKTIFIGDLMRGVDNIAKTVVGVLNQANQYIQQGKADSQKEFDKLSPKEQTAAETTYMAVTAQYQTLEESVRDRQNEIIADMARNYSRSVGKLQSTFDEIKKDVLTSWLEKAWNKIKAVVNAIIEFATRIVQLLGRIAYLAGDIISSPRAFFRNLATGISDGFSQFIEGIGGYLATAFFDWLRGASGVQIQMPKEFGPAGIFSLFTQLLNLSTETIWERMEVVYDKTVADVFRRGEAVVHKGLEIFEIVKNEGLGGLWDHIKESLGTLLDDTLGMIKETVLYAAVKKILIEIGKMLVPGGGFIAIAEKVFRLLQFIVEARNKILDLIESFVDSMEMAVQGNVAGIAKHITGALTKFITVALDFLVTFFGLSDLKGKVTRFIDRLRTPVIRGIDWVLKKLKPLVMKGKELVAKAQEAVVGAGKKIVGKVKSWLGIQETFEASDGVEHKLYFAGSETNQVLMVASNPTAYATFIKNVEVGTDQKKQEAKGSALTIAKEIDDKRVERLTGTTDEEKENSKQQKLIDVAQLLSRLAVPTKVLFGDVSNVGEPEIKHTTQAAGYGITMNAVRLNKHQKTKGSPPTSSMTDSYAILNARRQEDNPDASYYVKGHLLNEDLGGPGVWENLTPLSRKGNSDHESQVESLVKAAVKSGAVVEYNVIAVYGYGQNAGRIPDEDPKAAEKKRIIQEEASVPTTVKCDAFVLEKVDGKFVHKQSIVSAVVNNPIGQDPGSYVFSGAPPRAVIYLNDADADKIATIEGVDADMAAKIKLAHRKNEELNGRSRFNSWEELADARKNLASHRVFPVGPEQERVKALANLKYVKLYKGAGKTDTGAEADTEFA